MGGLARRVSYSNLFSEKMKGLPSLLVDGGNYLTDERGYHGEVRPDVAVKDEWILNAYEKYGVDVANLSSHELRYAARLLKTGSEPSSIVRRLVSANIVSESKEFSAPPPFLVRELTLRNGGKLKVAIIGLTEAQPAPPRGFRIEDPAKVAASVAQTAKKTADVVVALARIKQSDARRVAELAPAIDVMLVAGADSVAESFTPPQVAGRTQIYFSSFETRMLGELRFYRQSGGGFGTRARYISLDDVVPDDRAALDFANAAKAAEEQTRSATKDLLEDWLSKSRSDAVKTQTSHGFTGSAACAGCHQGQYVKWSSGPHAHATDRLVQKVFEFEVGCLSCHASNRDPKQMLQSIQGIDCERCHGPGAEHASKPATGYGRIVDVKSNCLSCHTADTSPRFDLQSAMTTVKH